MMSRLSFRPALLLLSLLLAATPTIARAQAPGAVAGRAVSSENGAPIPLSVVRLLPSADTAGGRTTLTDASGAFRFDAVTPGAYRLRLERIGFTAAPTSPFAVRAGETAERTLRSEEAPVMIEALTVDGNACYTGDRLADEAPELLQLWREAQKGAEQRRSFQRQYAFRVDRQVRAIARIRVFRDQRVSEDTTVYHHPDSIRVREARRRADRASGGYGTRRGGTLLVAVPDELELLEDDFLVTHCLEGADEGDGVWTLRFRPARSSRDRERVELRGRITLDAATYAVRELAFEYLQGGKPWGASTLRYAPVQTPFGAVRLPVDGTVRGRPSGAVSVAVSGVTGTLRFTGYRDFERVLTGS